MLLPKNTASINIRVTNPINIARPQELFCLNILTCNIIIMSKPINPVLKRVYCTPLKKVSLSSAKVNAKTECDICSLIAALLSLPNIFSLTL